MSSNDVIRAGLDAVGPRSDSASVANCRSSARKVGLDCKFLRKWMSCNIVVRLDVITQGELPIVHVILGIGVDMRGELEQGDQRSHTNEGVHATSRAPLVPRKGEGVEQLL